MSSAETCMNKGDKACCGFACISKSNFRFCLIDSVVTLLNECFSEILYKDVRRSSIGLQKIVDDFSTLKSFFS